MKNRSVALSVLYVVVAFAMTLSLISCQAAAPTAKSASSPLLAQTGTGTVEPTATSASTAGANAASVPENLEALPFASAVRDVAQVAMPAVVQITNEVAVSSSGINQQSLQVPQGVGSGVIIDAAGHVLTNNHVVEGAQALLVSLPDGRSFTAKLIGADPQTDVAVVQINDDTLPVAKIGDATKLQVGDWVVAIGNALALPGGPTVTAGVVSALGRSAQEPGTTSSTTGPFLFDLIQTDAPINPGNSGGALINLNSEVVGINTLGGGTTPSGQVIEGIGFAISINSAMSIAQQLIATGKVVHPYVGVSYVPLTPALALQLGIPETTGILIGSVVTGSPADKAGLQAQDVITQIDGKDLVGESDFAQIISEHKPGDTLKLTVIRGTQTMTIDLTLGTAPGG